MCEQLVDETTGARIIGALAINRKGVRTEPCRKQKNTPNNRRVLIMAAAINPRPIPATE